MTSGDTTAARKRRANSMGEVYIFYSLKRGDDQANKNRLFQIECFKAKPLSRDSMVLKH
jgi:hypothetical protein